MKLAAVLVAAGLLVGAQAVCPSGCSGHGVCRAHDRCTCYANWQGYDCSQRTCPAALAWADVPHDHDEGHYYAECAARGSCDRKTGECKCFDGYEGDACRRLKCPGDCSGHGTCEYTSHHGEQTSVGDFWSALGAPVDKGVKQGRHEYGLWDAKMTRSCSCDAGYAGIDCATRMCPKGNDPLTTESSNGLTEVHDVQLVTVGSSGGADAAGFWTLSFEDSYGHVWTTRPIRANDATETNAKDLVNAAEVKSALMALPNHVIDTVEVTRGTDTNYATYRVTFNSPATQGDQKRMTCNFAGCNTDGCQPRFVGVTGTNPKCTVTGYDNSMITSGAVDASNSEGSGENAECSNRGICDGSSGLCECFEGYTGESCSIQTILV